MSKLDRRAVLSGLSLALVAPLAGARGQSLAEIDAREAAVVDAWEKTPLSVRRAMFVPQKAAGFGMYEARPNGIFKAGEPLVAYAEPVGYGWKPVGDRFEFGFVVDFLVKRPTGEVLAGKEEFARLVQQSHYRNREFMVTLTLDVTGASPGDYVLEYRLRDVTGPKQTSFSLPFTLAA